MYPSQNERKQILHHDQHLVIKYVPESNVMYCYWRGFIAAGRIQQLGALMIRFVKEKGVSRVLNDNTGVVGPWSSIAPWVVQQWFPEMFSAGMRYFAWVMPENDFALQSARHAMPNVSSVKAFQEEEDAIAWLASPDGVVYHALTGNIDSTDFQGRALYTYLCVNIQRYDPAAAAVLQSELVTQPRLSASRQDTAKASPTPSKN